MKYHPYVNRILLFLLTSLTLASTSVADKAKTEKKKIEYRDYTLLYYEPPGFKEINVKDTLKAYKTNGHLIQFSAARGIFYTQKFVEEEFPKKLLDREHKKLTKYKHSNYKSGKVPIGKQNAWFIQYTLTSPEGRVTTTKTIRIPLPEKGQFIDYQITTLGEKINPIYDSIYEVIFGEMSLIKSKK